MTQVRRVRWVVCEFCKEKDIRPCLICGGSKKMTLTVLIEEDAAAAWEERYRETRVEEKE